MDSRTAHRPAVAFRQVSKRFGRQSVLSSLDLEIDDGEAFGLVGVNGAGKTTSIKLMLDFSDFDAGRIEIYGVSSRDPESRRTLAYLPERFLPPYYLTGREFLDYMAKLHGARYDESGTRALFGQIDLDASALEKPVRQYSKGMAQKLGLAACFLSDRPLLILDEPMSGLDPKARLLVKRVLAAKRAQGRTLFFSTHMLADVEELCDRMGILHDGAIRFVGTPAECRARFGADTLEQAYLTCISPVVSSTA